MNTCFRVRPSRSEPDALHSKQRDSHAGPPGGAGLPHPGRGALPGPDPRWHPTRRDAGIAPRVFSEGRREGDRAAFANGAASRSGRALLSAALIAAVHMYRESPPQPETPSFSDGWTGRRRLLAALACGTPDRVPINTYELAGRDSLDWYNQQPGYLALMDMIREHTDCITNWNPQAIGDSYLSTERFLCSDYPVDQSNRELMRSSSSPVSVPSSIRRLNTIHRACT